MQHLKSTVGKRRLSKDLEGRLVANADHVALDNNYAKSISSVKCRIIPPALTIFQD